jgi:hypothetical protein
LGRHVVVGWDNLCVALDPTWIGVIGAGIGAMAAGLTGLGTAVVQRLAARDQRKHDADEAKVKREADAEAAKAQREHEDALHRQQQAIDKLEQRRETITHWRTQLEEAGSVFTSWRARSPSSDQYRPNIVGQGWFEELRGYLPETSRYVGRTDVYCDPETVTALSIEISRIERRWTAEAD